jgi:hypothetical protein
MAWGRNQKGELGDGSSMGPEQCTTPPIAACSKVPAQVSGLSGVAAVAAGYFHGLALLGNGRVMAWGLNGDGQLGDGTAEGPENCERRGCSTKPVEVSKLAGAKGIGAGEEFSLAFGPPPPTVTAITPQEGAKGKGAGTSVTITGADFEEASAVKFGSNDATSFKVNSEASITAVAPPGSGTVDVTVTTPAGTSLTSSADTFYYQRPAVKRLSPKRGPELGGTSVTITGTNFAGVTAVKFGPNDATSFKVNSVTSITAVSPAHTSGNVDVTITTPDGTSAISGKDRFKYT